MDQWFPCHVQIRVYQVFSMLDVSYSSSDPLGMYYAMHYLCIHTACICNMLHVGYMGSCPYSELIYNDYDTNL